MSNFLIIFTPRHNQHLGRDPFNQNFRKFRSKTQWITVRSNRKSFEKSGPPFEVDHFSRLDRLEFWLNGSRPWSFDCVTARFDICICNRLLTYRSNRSFNMPPPGQPPGHLTFLKIIVQIPLYQGQNAVQMPHTRVHSGDQMPPPRGHFTGTKMTEGRRKRLQLPNKIFINITKTEKHC